MSQKQLVIISLLLVAGIGVIALGAFVAGDDNRDVSVTSNAAIDALIPARDSEVIPQSNVGVDLADGYEAEIVRIGSTPIPLDQQFIQPVNQRVFRPEEGLALERLPAQDVCAEVRYWPIRDRENVATITWCFRVIS